MIVGTFGDAAIKTHPTIAGMAASFIKFSLPVTSIRNPPIIPLRGMIITTTLAEKELDNKL